MALQSLKSPSSDENSDRPMKPAFASLVAALLPDVKRLLSHKVRLAKHEMQQELGKAQSAAVSIGIAVPLAAIGGLLLIVMLVSLLQALSGLPLWVSYAIVGGLVTIGGVFLLIKGKQTAGDIHITLPQTGQTLKETVAWIKDQAQSHRISKRPPNPSQEARVDKVNL